MINQEVLEDLRRLGDDDAEFFKKLLFTFLQTIQERLPVIEDAVHLKSAEKLSAAAHALKSSSYNLGAQTMGDLCTELEKCGKTNSLQNADALFKKLEAEVKIVSVEIIAQPEMKK
jgi:HPt (histidine-containing phosphotransfer) domain-containing protein